jgi:hypothetical protein
MGIKFIAIARHGARSHSVMDEQGIDVEALSINPT